MRTRRRPPSLVSMWMLDVFCCALGCVTLLWLLSNRSAQDEAARNRESVEVLARTESALQQARADALAAATAARNERDAMQTQLAATTAERDALQPRFASAERDLAATTDALNSMKSELNTAETERSALAAKVESESASAKALAAKLADADKRAESTAADLAAKRAEVAQAETRVEAATKALAEGQREMAAVGQQKRATGDTLRQTKDELTQARATIVDLQGQKAKLADKIDKIQSDVETRFAGITLTGRRVVFMVDVSGSMKLLDDHTPAPDKWGTVIDTVARVMKSLPNLEQFQVVTFSKQSATLFPGEWQEYQGDTSVAQVRAALTRVNPEGDTNLYDAFELAFRQKSAGLDTIYVFSDGLPTSGQGMTAAEQQISTPQARSDVLAKHVLQTLKARWNRAGPGRVKVNAVGFYFESPDVGAFLWALARDNEGSFVGMSRP